MLLDISLNLHVLHGKNLLGSSDQINSLHVFGLCQVVLMPARPGPRVFPRRTSPSPTKGNFYRCQENSVRKTRRDTSFGTSAGGQRKPDSEKQKTNEMQLKETRRLLNQERDQREEGR